MNAGREFRSGVVLSDAGAANTLERLLSPNLSAMDSLRRQLHRLQPSTAHASLYVGLSQSDAAGAAHMESAHCRGDEKPAGGRMFSACALP
jgi:hypothetical protein